MNEHQLHDKGEEMVIEDRNGNVINSTLYQIEKKSENKSPIVILCHGFTGDQNEWGRFNKTAEKLNENGFDALLFDFAGSGLNKREEILLSKQIRNLEDVFAWVKLQGYTNMSTIGLSFGGITSLVADLHERKVAIFWAPAFYLHRAFSPLQKFFGKIAASLFPNKKIWRDSKNNEKVFITSKFVQELTQYDADDYLKEFLTPSLLIQGTADMVVGAENNYEAFEKFPKDDRHKLVKIEGATHDFDGILLDRFIEETIEWLRKYT